LIGLAKLYYNTKRKANKLKKHNAELQDATNPDGVLQRMTTLMSGRETPRGSSRDTATLGAAGGSMYQYGVGGGAGGASSYIGGGTTLIGSGAHTHHLYTTQPRDLKEHGRDYEAEELAKYNALQHYNEANRRGELDGTPTHPRSPYHSPRQSPHYSPIYDQHTRSPHRSLVYDNHTRAPVHSPIRSPVYQERSPIYDDSESDYRSQRVMRNWGNEEEEDTIVVGGLGELSMKDSGRDSWEGRWGV
jgi:hypothetical protein